MAGRVTKRWEPEDVARLRAIFADHSNDEVAARLGRSRKAVETMATRLGLRKTRQRRAHAGRVGYRAGIGGADS